MLIAVWAGGENFPFVSRHDEPEMETKSFISALPGEPLQGIIMNDNKTLMKTQKKSSEKRATTHVRRQREPGKC
jgi:hypothetical protein